MLLPASFAGVALAGALLAGCTSGSDSAAAGNSSPADTSSGSSASSGSSGSSGADGAACATSDLTITLGDRTAAGGTGQYTVPIQFQNNGDSPCTMTGAPIVTLQGPDDPNGNDYKLTSPAKSGSAPVTVAPGSTAVATLTVLTPEGGSTGSNGSTSWTPTQLVTSAPGDTSSSTTATVAWPSDLPVLRQDTATRQGTYVGPVTAQ